ncbi:GMC family oxidoreductase [Aspergillus chevalieri]|uniref:Glucose-methanol-choline oxidoreductase N-terminal domain-containing protein n=1 Tax=Aspergillus chevalieri TaxID=182096 RepID=A0A7R7ZQF7_ASPCH|nr:uncharacterized protein ACHE_50767A [Aspergillus chevalieri]BCR89569.1 hypothetical protein ACHE_50767A [Aspergillus chevalieri]
MRGFLQSSALFISLALETQAQFTHETRFSTTFGLASQNKTFDYVIVGGGTAGLTTAMRLSENNTASVAVIEAGGFYQMAGNLTTIPGYESEYQEAPPSIDWMIRTTNQSNLEGRSVLYPQGKCFGGSSARNGMAYQRGTASSYDLWAKAIGDDSYRFDQVLPYFQKSVQFDSSQTAFLETTMKNSDSFQTYPGTLAKQVLFDGAKRATGVRVDTAGTEYVLSAKKEVILAAGVFRTPQLLMASGVGPAQKLEGLNIPLVSNLSGVGQNLLDNPGYGTLYPVNAVSQHRLWSNSTYAAEAHDQFYKTRSGPLTTFASNYILWENLPNTTAQTATTSTHLPTFPPDWPDIQYIFNAAGTTTTETADYISIGVVVLKATSRGQVGISSADTADNPLVDVNWLNTKSDQKMLVEGLRRVRVFANATGVLAGEEILPGPDVQSDGEILNWVRSAATPSHHAVGTCKMGRSNDTSAVVDSAGRVLGGISGLRVVDASVMPVLPPGQPMSTVCEYDF